MTPLAHAVAVEMCKPVPERRLVDHDHVQSRLLEFAFFDCSAVAEMLEEIAPKVVDLAEGPLCFLPAPRTWIEFGRGAFGLSGRLAILAETEDDGTVTIRMAGQTIEGDPVLSEPAAWMPGMGSAKVRQNLAWEKSGLTPGREIASILILALALINTPRVIGRRQHMPHAGLQRKIAAAKGMVGKFPLHGWTEILLEVAPPAVDCVEHEARLSGGKALHFCRAHLRIRNGRVEFVTAHWRGDPSLGMKRTRYRVAPPKRPPPDRPSA